MGTPCRLIAAGLASRGASAGNTISIALRRCNG
jgi:hypothetical protein